MTEQNTEIDGQQTPDETIAETVGSEENPTADDAQTGTVESPDSASGNPETNPDTSDEDSPPASATTARTTDVSSAEDAPASQPASEPADDTPSAHKYRITHEESNPGDPSPHSIKTTAPLEASEAIAWLVGHARDLGLIAEDLSKFL